MDYDIKIYFFIVYWIGCFLEVELKYSKDEIGYENNEYVFC